MKQDGSNRPDPDALLRIQKRSLTGGLKIFLGASPGVGKTYKMLQTAHELKRQGLDIVVGIAETHGRKDTQALCEGLEILPLKPIAHSERQFEEFDLDAALQRKPNILIVDELAHRNIPGTRHPRRYQDIQELLDQGITVWTAINIQHIESLSDIVSGITGVRMRETVPDALLEQASDIVLVDLTPSELLERLSQGKVYVPEQARAAMDGFFSPSNLAALRELAVQTIADRLDADVKETMQSQGIEGPWHIRSRLLVAIDGSFQGESLVRAGRRLSDRRKAPWIVVYVDRGNTLSVEEHQYLNRVFELAIRLGAEVKTLRGYNAANEIIEFAKSENITTLILGRSDKLWWQFKSSTSQRILKDAEAFEVTFIPVPRNRRKWRLGTAIGKNNIGDYLWALGSVIPATMIAFSLEPFLPLGNLSLVYLTSVLWIAARTGIKPALFTAAISFLSYNFFFTEPKLTFSMNKTDELLTVVFFIIIAVIGGNLAGRLRNQILILRASANQTERQLQFTRRLASAPDIESVKNEALEGLYKLIKAPLVIIELQQGSNEFTEIFYGQEKQNLDPKSYTAIDWSLKNKKSSGAFSDTLNSLSWRFEPIEANDQIYALLGINTDGITSDQYKGFFISVYTNQLGLAWFRTQLATKLSESRVAEETERLRSALLSSISHDLRTPLAAMIGSASTLQSMFDRLSTHDRESLLNSVLGEGHRLDRYITNLLDMTRLGHGTLKIERDWIAVTDILSSAIRRTRALMSHITLVRNIESDLPLIYVHPALIEQAFVNVLENAAKFAPEHSMINIEAFTVTDTLYIRVIDQGPGIPIEQRDKVFDMFFTGGEGDRGPYGSGLGLAICNGMIGAHGGEIEALTGPDNKGTIIEIKLPIGERIHVETEGE